MEYSYDEIHDIATTNLGRFPPEESKKEGKEAQQESQEMSSWSLWRESCKKLASLWRWISLLFGLKLDALLFCVVEAEEFELFLTAHINFMYISDDEYSVFVLWRGVVRY